MLNLLLVLLQLYISSNHVRSTVKEKEMVFEIDFQDFFLKDTASLNINGSVIFKENQLTSDRSTGLTNIITKGYLQNNDTINVIFKNTAKHIEFSNNKISISLIFNHYPWQYLVDLSKGKYIGFSKKGKNEIVFRQSLKPFVYD